MKLSKLAMLAAIACGVNTGFAADYRTTNVSNAVYNGNQTTDAVVPVGCCDTCGQPACGCEPACDPCCGAEEACCDSACDGCDAMLAGAGSSITDALAVHGWLQLGYHSNGSRFNGPGGPFSSNFNDNPDGVRLHQAYIYSEKIADGSKGLGLGYRVDYVYGIDGPDTQSFGQDSGFDSRWDNGGFYGSAMPQLYAEVAYGDTSVKIGHFYTTIGYEVVPATGNFFYSHSYTMYNSEPFTHTGVLATTKMSDSLTVYNGYVLGWDSGFEDNGDAYLGGMTYAMSEDITVTGGIVAGRFNEATNAGAINANERGHMTSVIVTAKLTDKLTYVLWNDHLKETKDPAGAIVRDTLDVTQYLIYQVDDKLGLATRFEWYGLEGAAFPRLTGGAVAARAPFDRSDVLVLTVGANYKPMDNFVIRPELRWDWDKDLTGINDLDSNGNVQSSQCTFGIDAILSF